MLDQWVHLDAAGPYDSGSLQRFLVSFVLESEIVACHFYDSRFRVYFNARLSQRIFDEFADLLTHSRNDSVAHFNHEHARLAVKCATLERIVEQVSHFGRELTPARAGAHYRESQFATNVLRWHVRWY